MVKDNILNDEQREALNKMEKTEGNIWIDGGAGTGKSTLIREYLRRSGLRAVMCASTAIAANNINGVTIHSLLKAPCAVIPKWFKPAGDNALLDAADIIVIDEIGTCRCDLFSYCIRSIRESERRRPRSVRIIVTGDFNQLGPVVTGKDRAPMTKYWGKESIKGYPFLTEEWQVCCFERIQLSKQMRMTDRDYFCGTELVKHEDLSAVPYLNKFVNVKASEERTLLTPRKKEVKKRNEEKMEELKGEARTYKLQRTGDYDIREEVAYAELMLKVGAPVIAICNDPNGRFFNGTQGTVLGLGDKTVTVLFNNGRVVNVDYYEWKIRDYDYIGGQLLDNEVGSYRQIPLIPGFAMTIHRAQGLTLDSIAVDPRTFAAGQLYTAITRVRSAKDICFTRPVDSHNIITDPQIQRFYSDILMKTG